MAARIHHRGPDEQGLFTEGPVALAIQRLSIIDVAGGHQPYRNETGDLVCVFNGEIYNFQELRAGLQERGHRFATHADGEVIVHLYEERGVECLEALNGMFALALWDRKRERLFLARDRLGIKPLYTAEIPGGVAFASELKALLELPTIARRLNPVALDQYLTFEYVPAPESILEGISKLPPAHILVRDPATNLVQCYWELKLREQDRSLSPRDWQRLLRQSLKQSVQRMLISEVPLGVFLSGGIDSSAVAALARETTGRVKTFSIGFQDRTYDESSHARLVARELGTEHHEELLDPRASLEVLDPVVDQLDEPLGDAAILPTYLLSRYARQSVTVVLTGEGADELLAGYPTYPAHAVAAWLPRPLSRVAAWTVNRMPVSTSYLSLDFKLKRFFRHASEPVMPRHFHWMGSFTAEDKRLLYTSSFQASLPHEATWRPLEEHRAELAGLDLIAGIQHLDLHFYLPDDLLVKLDRATMAVSLEGRVPYLDHTLVELLARVPMPLKLRGMNGKWLLKQAMKDSLPASILKRPKKGFGIPVAQWLKTDLKPLLDRCLEPERLRRQGLFDPAFLGRMVQQHLAGKVDHRKPLWTMLMFQLWHERWME